MRSRIIIIGGGFSGAVVALSLLERGEGLESVTIIEPRPVLGAGVAYSSPDPAHRVNVPAIRLLVAPGEPGAFHDWLETSGALRDDPEAQLPDGRRYPRRSVFGRYVQQRLMQAVDAPGAPAFAHLRATAEAVERQGQGFRVVLDDGRIAHADILVLAVSHPRPSVLSVLRPLSAAEKFFPNPWEAQIAQKIGPRDRVLMIGTALSTADCIATLDAAGHAGDILAISRRGLVSRERRLTANEPFGDFTAAPSRSCVALLRTVRAALLEAPCWEVVIETLRNQGQAIWAALPTPEKRRFLRHLRPYWDVHRYQLAPQLGAVMARRAKAGTLQIRAARILAAGREGEKFRVTLQCRGRAEAEDFDAIINCTGPDHARVTETNPALASLRAAGLIAPDVFGLGLETDAQSHALDVAGQRVEHLFIAGPLARATFGELMGLPQVTEQAAAVGRYIAARCARSSPRPDGKQRA